MDEEFEGKMRLAEIDGMDELDEPHPPELTGDKLLDERRYAEYRLELQRRDRAFGKSKIFNDCETNGKIVKYEKKFLFRLLADDTYELCLCLREPGETFVIPSSLNGKPVTKIGEYAFTLDKDYVGYYHYDENNLFAVSVYAGGYMVLPTKSVEFPESFNGFDEHFRNWMKIFVEKGIKVTINEKNPNFLLVDYNLYTKDGKTLLYALGHEKTLIVPDGVTEIAQNALPYVEGREYFVIPKEMELLHDTSTLKFFYKGSKKEWKELLRRSSCKISPFVIVYFYNESASASGDHWHFAKDGVTPEFKTSFLTKLLTRPVKILLRVIKVSLLSLIGK